MSGVDLIIFGATGDLSARKLFPALFQLDAAGLLSDDLRIVAVARQEQTSGGFHDELRERMFQTNRSWLIPKMKAKVDTAMLYSANPDSTV